MGADPNPLTDVELAVHCALVGSNLERADLRGKNLRGVNFSNANLRGADLSRADLREACFVRADLSRACLYGADCRGADFSGAEMSLIHGRAADFSRARFWSTSLRRAIIKNALFFEADLRTCNVAFTDFLGCRFNGALLDGVRNADKATFFWYYPEGWRGHIRYDPAPGYVKIDTSVLGGLSLQENTHRKELELA